MKNFGNVLTILLFVLSTVAFAQQVATPKLVVTDNASDVRTKTFRGGLDHNGKYDGNGFSRVNHVLWKFHAGGRISSSPAVASNRIYFGSSDGYLYCLDSGTGNLQWKFKATAGISSSPALENDLVYFQSDDNHLFAVSTQTGKVKWHYQTGTSVPFDGRCSDCATSEEGGWDFWVSSPVIALGGVYFGSGDSYVYALNAINGKLNWKFKTGGRVRSSPAVFQKVVYVGSLDGKMYAINADHGDMRWSFKTEGNKYYPIGEIQSSPAVANGRVIFGSRDYNLYALEPMTGKLIWKTLHDDSWILGSPAITNDSVYIGSSDGRFLQKVDLDTGKEIWRAKVGLNIYSSPAIAGEHVYIGTARGEMLGFDENTGKVKAGFLIDEAIHSSPVVANGVVYFGAENGNLYAVTSN
ncbi:MAG: PQQ-binding-like beta-propeller repeat protein [Pyrinomonadaceae bacterium]